MADRKGKCSACGRPAVEGGTRCEIHIAKAKEQAAARYAKKRAAGVCPLCPKTAAKMVEPGKSACAACLAKQNEKAKAAHAADPTKQHKRSKEWFEKRKAAGICPQCNERPAEPDRIHCGPCGREKSDQQCVRHAKLRDIVLARYGNACVLCGEAHKEFLEVDHVGGGGTKHLREIGPSKIFQFVIDAGFPAEFRVLCCNCNFEHGQTLVLYGEHHDEPPDRILICLQCGKEPARLDKTTCNICARNQSERDRKLRNKRREQVLDHYGRECACCGGTRALQIDHIEGDGHVHRNAVGLGSVYRDIIRREFPEGFRTLCANCNSSHGRYGYCPHQRPDTQEPPP